VCCLVITPGRHRCDDEQPFVVERANQEYLASNDISLLLQCLSRMLSVPSPLVQLAALEVFLDYASAGDDGNS
jgi:hypothetical protein